MYKSRVIVVMGDIKKRKMVEKYLFEDFKSAGVVAKKGIHNDCEYSIVEIDLPSELEMYAEYPVAVFDLLEDDVKLHLPTVKINSTYTDNRMKVAVRRGIESITTFEW